MPVSPPLSGSSPVLTNIIKNQEKFSIAGHENVNICNKALNTSDYGAFAKSIMPKIPP